jgi:RNA polymerase sigma factor (TIGR02999 family)
MDDITQMLRSVQEGEPCNASDLLPLVYSELRRLAEARMSHEPGTQTLQPTALVHEAFLRLVCDTKHDCWNSKAHFFGAAAEAMRRILVENARRKRRVKHGGQFQRVHCESEDLLLDGSDEQVLALDEALQQLEIEHPEKAVVVKLRYFAGMTNDEVAKSLGVSTATAQRYWQFAKAWLFAQLCEE